LDEFQKHIPSPDIPIALAGNKKDLEGERVVTEIEAHKLAESLNLKYYETSALEGGSVINEIFDDLAQQVIDKKGS
jgi:GTPase SAR1 family protein